MKKSLIAFVLVCTMLMSVLGMAAADGSYTPGTYTAEAKGIPLAHEMARQAGNQKYILARKGPKLYMRDLFSVSVHSITTAKEQHLYLDVADAELMRGKRILIVDDVISTGGECATTGQIKKGSICACGQFKVKNKK